MVFEWLKPGRRAARTGAFLGLTLVAGIAGWNVSMLYTRYRAESLLREVRSLRVGESRIEDAQRLFDKYGGWKEAENDSICSGGDCLYFSIPVYNKALEYSLRGFWIISHACEVWRNPCCNLIPWRGMGVGIHVKGGRIVRIEMEVGSRRRDGYLMSGLLEVVPSIPSVHESLRRGYRPGWLHMTTPGGGEGVSAMIGATASCEDRKRAFDINLECMSTIRGCTELRQFMPSAWDDFQTFLQLHTDPEP